MHEYRFTDGWGFLVQIVGAHCDSCGMPLTSLSHDAANRQWVIQSPVEWPQWFVDHLREHETKWLAGEA